MATGKSILSDACKFTRIDRNKHGNNKKFDKINFTEDIFCIKKAPKLIIYLYKPRLFSN